MTAVSLPLGGRIALLALIAVCATCGTYGALRSERFRLLVGRYVESLDAPLLRMLQPARGRLIASLQAVLGGLCVGCAVALRSPLWAAPLLPLAAAPWLVIRYAQSKRRARIEAKLDVLALALANATRATPSVGRALQMLAPSLAAPIDAEVAQVLRELRVGSSLEHALLKLSWRVQSPSLDALLSSVLIARRVGGDLPGVLETTAATLRELARLDGVLRAKTAQGRTQMWVLGSLPPVLVLAFNLVKPGYFDPLLHTPVGQVMMLAAVLAWIGSVLLARRILQVEL
ncbi:MAG: type II secretion system F family protein [Polyangiales bacterium]